MRAITKEAEPSSLTLYRAQNNPPGKRAFQDYPDKSNLREQLIREQKGLCCYCMGRIENDPLTMKVDHFQCQDRYQDGRLTYSNLLGVCSGAKGMPKAQQHCDSRKGDLDLLWSPANSAHAIESRILYLADGEIKSADEVFNAQLNDVLGLNLKFMRNNRKAVLDSVLVWWRSTKDARQKVQEQIRRRTEREQLEPFSPVAVWFLRQKLGT